MKTLPRIFTRSLWLILALGLLLAPLTPSAQAAAAKCIDRYTVVAGDTLIGIADTYKVDWLKLAEANDLKAPYTLQVDQKLCIPEGATIPSGSTGSTGTTTTTSTNTTLENVTIKPTAITPNGKRLTVEISGLGVRQSLRFWLWTPVETDLPAKRIGLVSGRTKGGTVKVTFNLPSEYRGYPSYILCAKDMRSDETKCVTISVTSLGE